MFLLPRTRPLELEAHHVRALRPSLNTPVVAAPDLPVGPACAAILVHVEPGHGLQISVGVRSLGCGSIALYGFDAPIGASLVGVALDAALSFAESMGFLFDDDMVGDDASSREKAVLRWRELIGDAVLPRAGAAPAAGESDELFDSDGGELTDPPEAPPLDPPEAPPFEPSQQSLVAAEAAEFQPAEAPREVPLSKFRVQPKSEEPAAPGGTAEPAARVGSKRPLARIRLSKRRTGEPVLDARRAWLLRLLTSF